MPLTQQAIDELKQIHKEEFGEELANDEAWDMGIRLINLFTHLSKVKQLKANDKN
jgi:hypothetical protein